MKNKIEYEFVSAQRRKIEIKPLGIWCFAELMKCCENGLPFSPVTKEPYWEFICNNCGNKHEVKLISDDNAVVSTYRAVKVNTSDDTDAIAPPDNEGYFTTIQDGKFRFHWIRVIALLILVCLSVLFLVFILDIFVNA